MSSYVRASGTETEASSGLLIKSLHVLFFALVATLFVQIAVYESPSGGNTLNLYHLLIATAFVLTFRIRLSVCLSPDTIFFVVLTATSLMGWSVYGFPTRGLLLPLIYLAFAVGNRWQQFTAPEQRLTTYKRVFAVVVIAVVIRNLVFAENLGLIYSRTQNDTVLLLASGGQNLEATLLGMLSTLLVGTPAFFPAVSLAAVTSIMMMSRAGVLAALVSLMFWLIHGKFGRLKFYAGSTLLSVAIIACLLNFGGVYRIPILNRFSDLAVEKEYAAQDQGRLAIWNAAGDIIGKNPWGHGVGNGFQRLNEHIGGHLKENNAHNIFLEFALDGGIQSSLLFAIILLSNLFTRGIIQSPAGRFVLAYGILGLVEFTGFDAIGWFFIGVSHAARFNALSERRLS